MIARHTLALISTRQSLLVSQSDGVTTPVASALSRKIAPKSRDAGGGDLLSTARTGAG